VLRTREVTTPESISLADVSAFAQHLRTRSEKPLTASSMARMLSSVRSLHRFLLDEGLVVVGVAADVTPPKLANRLPKAITIEQMTSVLDAAAGDDLQSLRDRALLELLYATGARISEAVDLNVDDVIGSEGASVDVVRLFGKGGQAANSSARLLCAGRHRRVPGSGETAALDQGQVDSGAVSRHPGAPGARGHSKSSALSGLLVR